MRDPIHIFLYDVCSANSVFPLVTTFHKENTFLPGSKHKKILVTICEKLLTILNTKMKTHLVTNFAPNTSIEKSNWAYLL